MPNKQKNIHAQIIHKICVELDIEQRPFAITPATMSMHSENILQVPNVDFNSVIRKDFGAD